ncbi:MAG: hypothetical protein IPK83_23395 [Planctomycetes bacterium]|nr:hypothetical protein [Planctomycetota bacterium]
MQNANFPTPTGKAHFKAVQIPQQFNPMQYEPTNIEVRSAIPPTNGEHGPPARANRSTDQISEQTQLPLRLMTIRSEGQFNTVVYEDQDLYRGQDRRDIILLSADDMSLLGLRENALVTVRSQTGTMHDILARAFDIRPGNAAMYCPEANILVPRAVDPQSGTPAFKNVAITVEPESITRWEPDGRISLTISPNRPARPLSAC